jgi:glycosyltransferase involved in cell wall biosynthesis
MNPLISIVLCTYNGAVFLKEQLESLVAQSYPNFEIIICDDASLDGTIQLLAGYETNEHIHIYYNKVNMGLTNNIEQAIGFCKGEFIAFCDQDDVWKKDKLEILYRSIQEDVLVYSDSELIDENGKNMNIRLSQLRNMHTGNNNLGFVFSNCVWGHTILIRSSLLENILPIPANVPHDSWSGFVGASVKRIKYIDQPLNLYRQHQNTVTSTLPAAKYISDKIKKQEEYRKNLNWIKALAAFRKNPNKEVFKELLSLFVKKENKKFVWPLFVFLLKHQTALFAFSNKSAFSKFNEMRKLSRGIDLSEL